MTVPLLSTVALPSLMESRTHSTAKSNERKSAASTGYRTSSLTLFGFGDSCSNHQATRRKDRAAGSVTSVT